MSKPCVRWKTSDTEAVSCFKLATAAGLIDDSDTGCLVSPITGFSNICIGLRGQLAQKLKIYSSGCDSTFQTPRGPLKQITQQPTHYSMLGNLNMFSHPYVLLWYRKRFGTHVLVYLLKLESEKYVNVKNGVHICKRAYGELRPPYQVKKVYQLSQM